MDVSRVGQRPDALLQESASRREPPATERTERATRPDRTEPGREPEKVKTPEQPKPVVNTQGQTTGTRINTSA